MVKYYADREITNIYENLQKVWSQFFTDMLLFIYIWSNSNIGLSVFGFVVNEYKWIVIRSLLTIHDIQLGIWWTNPKVKNHYLPLLMWNMGGPIMTDSYGNRKRKVFCSFTFKFYIFRFSCWGDEQKVQHE